ncbi:MAG: hypothetical protein R6V49_11115 [Bacteroidales bacterium]
MRVFCNIIIVVLLPVMICAQEPEPVRTFTNPRNFISLSPVRVVFFDQAGLSYEYRYGFLGLGLAAGYKYASGRNYTRLFIATSNNNGAYEFYTGFYAMPQVNLYFNRPKPKKINILGYLSLKGNYKYLHVDSTEFHVWNNNVSEDNFVYRRQIDEVNIIGATGNLGLKLTINHFFIDYNFGVGWIYHDHKMLVAGLKTAYAGVFPPGPGYPFRDDHTFSSPTVNFCLSIGYCF